MVELQKGKDPSGRTIWLLLDRNYLPVEPVVRYLNFIVNRQLSPNTVESYARNLKTYFNYLESRRMDWREISLQDLGDYVHWLRVGDGDTGEILRTERTVNHAITIIREFYIFQQHNGTLDGDKSFTRESGTMGRQFKPFLAGLTKSRPGKRSMLKLKEPRKFPGCLTKEEVKTLVDACNSLRDKLLIKVLYETGMRKGELLGLRIEDMGDGARNEIAIVERDNRNGARVKNGAERTVNVSKELMQSYEQYLIEEYPDVLPDYVFVNLRGENIGAPMNYRSLNQLMSNLSDKTGINVHPHLFRHTHATELIREGMDMFRVSKRLGHRSLQTTMNTYTHLSDEDLRRAIDEDDEDE